MGFIKRFWQKPPLAFPLIALFHIGLLVYILYRDMTAPEDAILGQTATMLLYTIAWLLVCDMRKWAVFVYMGLTTANLWARFVIDDTMIRNNFTDVIFPADVVFTFILLLYYKKFD